MSKNSLKVVTSVVDPNENHWNTDLSSKPLYVRGTDLHMTQADKLDAKIRQFNLENLTKKQQAKLETRKEVFIRLLVKLARSQFNTEDCQLKTLAINDVQLLVERICGKAKFWAMAEKFIALAMVVAPLICFAITLKPQSLLLYLVEFVVLAASAAITNRNLNLSDLTRNWQFRKLYRILTRTCANEDLYQRLLGK